MTLPTDRVGLKAVEPLVVDDSPASLEVIGAVLLGFGINRATKCRSAAEARTLIAHQLFDIVLVDCEMPGEDGLSLVEFIRSNPDSPNFTVPIIMLSASTPQSKVERGRDMGANFTIAKPLSPAILLDRMIWIARNNRAFVASPTYTGPDRRVHKAPPPDGMERRSELLKLTDLPERALSQADIDGLFP